MIPKTSNSNSESCNFPKVVVISFKPFNRIDNTGITLSNLFDGWDKNSIAQIYWADIEPEVEVCKNYFKLSSKIAYVDYYIRKLISVMVPKRRNSMSSTVVPLRKEEKNLRNMLHLHMRAFADFSPVKLPKLLFDWINEFNPDIIYCSLGDGRSLKIANIISRKIGKPIAPHFMDDWPSTLYTQNELYGLARLLVNKNLKSIFQKSNGGLCISELMVKEYENRYQKPFSEFVNCVEDSLFSKPKPGRSLDNIFTIIYIGGLHLNRWKSLLDVSAAIEKINENIERVILKIYCPNGDIQLYSKHFSKFNSTKFEGSLSSSEVYSKLETATVLLYLESFEPNVIKFTKFSLSTKIPQYMAAGKTILAYGSKSLASIQQIVIAKAGEVVIENKIEAIEEKINYLLDNQNSLSSYSENGYLFAKKFYSKSCNLTRLKRVLQDYSQKPIITI